MRYILIGRGKMGRLIQETAQAAGDEIEVVGPGLRPFAMTAPAMTGEEGEPLTEARRPQMRFTMRLPQYAPPLSIVRAQRSLSPNSPA